MKESESCPKNQNDHCLASLEKELEKIQLTLANFLIEASEVGDDLAEIQETRDQQDQIITTYKERQEEIERALRWIKKNGYICAVCHQPISLARIEADPASITCKEHLDQEDSVEI